MNVGELQPLLQNLKNEKITQSEIAKALGVSKQTISARAKQNSWVARQELDKIDKFFNVNIMTAWIAQQETSQGMPENTVANFVQLVYRPNVYLSAGYGVEINDEHTQKLVIDSNILMSERGLNVNPKYCEIVKVSGNSMSPEYQHGDRVIIDKNDKNLTDGQIYAIRYDGQCYIKEINRAGNQIRCISVNKEYRPFDIERDVDFEVFGRIIPRVRL